MKRATNIIDVLSRVNGASFISIDTRTVPTIRKTIDTDEGRVPNPHHGRVQKLHTGASVMVFQNKMVNGYESMIQRRLLEEGKDPRSFVLSERRWGTRVPNLPIVENKGEYYLEVIFLRAGETQWLLDGQPVSKDQILGLSESEEGEQGGLDNKVIIRTYKMSSISAIRINKQVYTNFYCEM